MISSPKDYLTGWYTQWSLDLEENLQKQEALKADEQAIRTLLYTCEQAFAMLFASPTPTKNDTTPTERSTELPADSGTGSTNLP